MPKESEVPDERKERTALWAAIIGAAAIILGAGAQPCSLI